MPTKEIAPGVHMPVISLGTCCGSDPSVGVGPWLAAGGTGIDTAYNYNDQPAIQKQIAASGAKREDLFITTKVPGISGDSLSLVKTDLKQLGTDYVDLVLLHMPGLNNAKQWQGLEQALAQNLTRAIGVSNYGPSMIDNLLKTAKVKPAVNQCGMSVKNHNDAAIKHNQDLGITYEAYDAMKGCDFKDKTIAQIAASHGKSAAQVCLRFIVDRGCVMAVGTGSDKGNAPTYSKENLDIFDFKLSDDEVTQLGKL